MSEPRLSDDRQPSIDSPTPNESSNDWPSPLTRAALHDRIERTLALPMLILSVGFAVVILWPIADPHLSSQTAEALNAVDWAIWAAFAVEYLVLLVTAPQRWRFVRSHVLDLLLVALPMLRPLRLVRSARLLRLARLGRLIAAMANTARLSRNAFFSRAVAFAGAVAGVCVLTAALVVLDLERSSPDSHIRTLGDSLWWAIATSTTVGYGDLVPVTAAGRAVGAVLMVVGVSSAGVVTATAAAWLVTITGTATTSQTRQVDALSTQVQALQASVDRLTHALEVTQNPVENG